MPPSTFMATASKPSMGVAPPEGGDCSWLAAGRLFLFPPKMMLPQPRELQHQAASPQPPQAPKPGWCPAWHQTALEPSKVSAPTMPTLPATKPGWGPTPRRKGLNPLRAPTPPTPALPPFRGEQQPSPPRSIAAARLQLLPWHRGMALPQRKPFDLVWAESKSRGDAMVNPKTDFGEGA